MAHFRLRHPNVAVDSIEAVASLTTPALTRENFRIADSLGVILNRADTSTSNVVPISMQIPGKVGQLYPSGQKFSDWSFYSGFSKIEARLRRR